MKDYSEKRQYTRYDYQTPMSLYPKKLNSPFPEAKMKNYSNDGMYFQTNEKLKIGEHIYIQIDNHDSDLSGPEKYSEYSGYVRWSEELGTSYGDGNYGYGIQYSDPVYY